MPHSCANFWAPKNLDELDRWANGKFKAVQSSWTENWTGKKLTKKWFWSWLSWFWRKILSHCKLGRVSPFHYFQASSHSDFFQKNLLPSGIGSIPKYQNLYYLVKFWMIVSIVKLGPIRTKLNTEIQNTHSFLNGSQIDHFESVITASDFHRLSTTPTMYKRIKSANSHLRLNQSSQPERPKSAPVSGKHSTCRRVTSTPVQRTQQVTTPSSGKKSTGNGKSYYTCHRPQTANVFMLKETQEDQLKQFQEKLIQIEKAKRPEFQRRVDEYCKLFVNMKKYDGFRNNVADMEGVERVLDDAYFRVHQKYPTRSRDDDSDNFKWFH